MTNEDYEKREGLYKIEIALKEEYCFDIELCHDHLMQLQRDLANKELKFIRVMGVEIIINKNSIIYVLWNKKPKI